MSNVAFGLILIVLFDNGLVSSSNQLHRARLDRIGKCNGWLKQQKKKPFFFVCSL